MTTSTNNPRTGTGRQPVTLLALAATAAAIALAGGCRGDRTDAPPRQFFPDMDDQPRFDAQSETSFFEDGRIQRLPVDRTVAFGSRPQLPGDIANAEWDRMILDDRRSLLKADETFAFGLVEGSTADEPEYVAYMPVPVTSDLIKRGEERFNIYCSACHGYDGEGGASGTVGALWSYAPSNLLADQYRDRDNQFGKDGYLFHIIRDGLWGPDGSNRMPAYGYNIDEQDAWAIVAYIRTLQAASDVPFDELDPADQARLEGGNP
ncbi:MAG: cytochrome c [Planctomycetota bacterium]